MTTNTLIITFTGFDSRYEDNVGAQLDAIMDFLKVWLYDNILTKFEINNSNPLVLLKLEKFKRILIVAPDHQLSELIISSIVQSNHFSELYCRICYTLQDSKINERTYLEVPKSQKLFLISPPVSPPPEFDFERVEDEPSRITHHIDDAPKAMTSFPAETNELKTTATQDIPTLMLNGADKPDGHRLLLSSSVANITLQRRPSVSVNVDDEPHESVETFKTVLPPKSTFDDDSDLEE
ncbi:hypothetical protein TPHA_0D01670 [Tetrapisispora phaffii CBS 4417]|uniref:Calcipressin n=1 Tax=Tetrapisispora phaffii (strain ATCC 24235 / CBS 4417 / NBRC 1672 / NRRL Y-8282 / UCD 70-5) TaxID=1071381 RepID=G8BSI6_TETPH|nr:hypothetical protein TPHA_0D01670 [Tetrapisispora phaffii CBS 4417]CCE62807.1 hypothetical protein TPHA_0D01670 [Tetrapisispora phaffii CBS 4417]